MSEETSHTGAPEEVRAKAATGTIFGNGVGGAAVRDVGDGNGNSVGYGDRLGGVPIRSTIEGVGGPSSGAAVAAGGETVCARIKITNKVRP